MSQNAQSSVLPVLADTLLSISPGPDAERAACEAVIDLITCAAAVSSRLEPKCLTDAFGPGPSSLWFEGSKLSPMGAGFANSLRAAELDLDDGHRKSRGHPGAAVIPAVFAEADRLDADGKQCSDRQILLAIIAGYEAGLRVSSARKFYARTGFWAGLAAAAGIGTLHRLSPDQLANAMAIAGETGPHMATTTSPPAWPQPNGTDVKEGIPWGVVTGLSSVHLARAGMRGALDLFDHEPFFDPDSILSARTELSICETYTKFYAACRHVHAPVDAFLDVTTSHKIDPAEIAKVEVAAYSGALRIPNRPDPRHLVDAQYSIPYCIALTALRGREALLPMTQAHLDDSEAEELARRISVFQDDSCESRFPAETIVKVTVHARGTVFESDMTGPRGEAHTRPGWRERVDKLRTATRMTMREDRKEALLKTLELVNQGSLNEMRNFVSHGR